MRVGESSELAASVASSTTSVELAEAQQRLNQHSGWCRVPESGRMTVETGRALREFQAEHGLEVTGRLDGGTLRALRRATGQHEPGSAAGRDEPAWSRPGSSPPPPRSTHDGLLARRLDRHSPTEGRDRPVRPSDQEPRPGGGRLHPRKASMPERMAVDALLALRPELRLARDMAMRLDKTLVVGVNADVSAIGHASLDGGLYFGPNGEIGVTGSAGIGVASSVSGAITLEVTVLDGGADTLDGDFRAVGFAGGQGIVADAALLYNERGERVGASFGIGPGLELAALGVIESYAETGTGAGLELHGEVEERRP